VQSAGAVYNENAEESGERVNVRKRERGEKVCGREETKEIQRCSEKSE